MCELCNRRKSDIVFSLIVGHAICFKCFVASKEVRS